MNGVCVNAETPFCNCEVCRPPQRRKRPNRPKVSRAVRAEVYKRDHYACRKCGATTNLTLDHIVPMSRGGANRKSNLQTLCETCNTVKGAHR